MPGTEASDAEKCLAIVKRHVDQAQSERRRAHSAGGMSGNVDLAIASFKLAWVKKLESEMIRELYGARSSR